VLITVLSIPGTVRLSVLLFFFMILLFFYHTFEFLTLFPLYLPFA
jgi:hypothetical protein